MCTYLRRKQLKELPVTRTDRAVMEQAGNTLLYDKVGLFMMTDVVKDAKNAAQDLEAKAKTAKEHAEGKPSSETLNKAKVKARDALD